MIDVLGEGERMWGGCLAYDEMVVFFSPFSVVSGHNARSCQLMHVYSLSVQVSSRDAPAVIATSADAEVASVGAIGLAVAGVPVV